MWFLFIIINNNNSFCKYIIENISYKIIEKRYIYKRIITEYTFNSILYF